ncbi:MAG TPA: 1,2-phenylacetyl-CoA epoxidase subunit PaaE [Candidatus Tyrphobacter sp.]
MKFHALTVRDVRKETRDAIVVEFDVPKRLREKFAFIAGQYLTLRTVLEGGEERRSYSICSSPRNGALRVAIKRVDDGIFSAWANATLAPGMQLEVAPPQGRFFRPLDPSQGRHYLAFAAGSGITPVLSLIETALAMEPRSRFTLVYGNRSSSSTMFREELLRLKDRYLGRFSLIFVTSREKQDVELFNGRIDRDRTLSLTKTWIDLGEIDYVFLCGPETMMESVAAALEEQGFDRERVIVERFTTEGRPDRIRRERAAVSTDGVCHVSVVLDGAVRTFDVRKGHESILDAGLRSGIDLPYSCKSGICSSCRAQLIGGEVDMDAHFALEDYEVRSGVVLMCQSHPVTDDVALDVDAIAAQLLGSLT